MRHPTMVGLLHKMRVGALPGRSSPGLPSQYQMCSGHQVRWVEHYGVLLICQKWSP